jgi:hypothetical protein
MFTKPGTDCGRFPTLARTVQRLVGEKQICEDRSELGRE